MDFVYNLGKAPASWDFLVWLMNVNIYRHEQGEKELGICFRFGPDGFRKDSMHRPLEQRQAILANVMRPALDFVGAKEVSSGDETHIHYTSMYSVDAHRRGVEIPKWVVPQYALDEARNDLGGRSPLVITLREATYYPERNSNIEAWKEFARRCGEDILFVRDTAKADEPLDGFETCPRASRDIHYRAAIMSLARCNLMVANGPVALATYMDVPYLFFGFLRPDLSKYIPGQASWFWKMGVPVGTNFPWAQRGQRIVWSRDSLDNILDAWKIHTREDK